MLTELIKSGIARAALALLSVLDAIQVTMRKVEIVHLLKKKKLEKDEQIFN